MSITFRALSATLVPLALVAAAAAAQEQPRAGFREELVVTEVLLDVLVTDSRGNVILGLEEDDFVVEENGIPMDLTAATFYSNRRYLDAADLAGRLGIEPQQVPVDRYFILFFDEVRRLDSELTSNVLDAVRRAKQWVYSQLLPNDWVAVVGWDAKLEIFQDFTTDNEKIEAALNQVAKGKDPGDVWASRAGQQEGPSLAVNLPKGKELQRRSTRIYNALETLAEAAGYITGRKNLIFFSIGFGEPNDFGTYIPNERYYPPMMQALNDNNVAVYAVSMVENIADEKAGQELLSNGMSLLADDTGGRYYFNFVNFSDPLERVVEDNNGYYLLSYSARHPLGEEGFRKVDVKTVNPDFVVRARQGYRFGG